MEGFLSHVPVALFLAAGVSAVLSMLVLQGRGVAGPRANRLRRVHRISGYLFVLLFFALFLGMLDRLPRVRTAGALPVLHVALAVVMVPMLLVKVATARWFKRLAAHLTGLGLAAFFLAVLLVVLPAMVPAGTAPDSAAAAVETAPVPAEDEAGMEALLQDRCTRCHPLDKVENAEKSLDQWVATIERMEEHAADPDFLSPGDAQRLARYLAGSE